MGHLSNREKVSERSINVIAAKPIHRINVEKMVRSDTFPISIWMSYSSYPILPISRIIPKA